MSSSLFALRFPNTVGYNTHLEGVPVADRGNAVRNAHRGQVLVIVPAECLGKNSAYQMAHTAITSVKEVRTGNTVTIDVYQNVVVYLPAEFNSVVEDCRSLAEVVDAVNSVGAEFTLSGDWDWLDYSLTQDRGVTSQHLFVGNPRRVRMSKADSRRVKRLK